MHVQIAERSIAAAIMDQDKRPEFRSAPWDEISVDAKHFLAFMFARKVRNRPAAWKALEHPWFSELYPGKTRFDGHHIWQEMTNALAGLPFQELGAHFHKSPFVQCHALNNWPNFLAARF